MSPPKGRKSLAPATSVRLRGPLLTLTPYVPGAPASAALYKLSSNENPFPPSARVSVALSDAVEDVNRYPQIHADALVEELALALDQRPERVVVGNGSVAVIELILRSLCEAGDEVVYPWRSFEAYPIAIQTTGASGVPVPNLPDGSHDLEGLAGAITRRTKAVLLCSPNNPTGTALTHTELVAFLGKVPPQVLVLLDEAYVEFVHYGGSAAGADPVDAVALLPVYRNLVLTRTFSKAYGLAGARVGYAVGRRRLMRDLRSASTPFGVNGLAQAGARAAFADQEHMRSQVGKLVQERERVLGHLRAQGWQLPAAQGNFYWLPVGKQTSQFAADAWEAGVVVRPFGNEGVRVSVGEVEANDLLLQVSGEWARRGRVF